MTTKIREVLAELGLIDSEIDIYLQLVKTSGIHPASVIAQRLKMNRTTVYKSLMKLTKMGLVTKSMKHGIICFLTEEPDKNIEKLLLQKKLRVNYVSKIFLESLSDLQNLQKEELYTPKMRYYEGLEGVKRVYEDTLIENETIYAFENLNTMDAEVYDYLLNDYIKRRTEKEIFAFVITPQGKSHDDYRSWDKKYCKETKFLSEKLFPMEIEMNIYGKKTAFVSYKTDEMFAVILESSSIANSMKAIFDACWKIAK